MQSCFATRLFMVHLWISWGCLVALSCELWPESAQPWRLNSLFARTCVVQHDEISCCCLRLAVITHVLLCAAAFCQDAARQSVAVQNPPGELADGPQ